MSKPEWPIQMSRYLGIGYFVHVLPLSAVALLILNDHYLKSAHPSWLTGKLSDFAGLFFFPIFLCALFNLSRNLLNQWLGETTAPKFSWITLRQAVIAVAITDLIFVSIKLVPSATHLYLQMMCLLGYPSRVTRDRTDLIALAMNPLTLWFVRSQAQSQARAGTNIQ